MMVNTFRVPDENLECHPLLFKGDDGEELFHITKEGEFVFPKGVEPKESARRFAVWFKESFKELL